MTMPIVERPTVPEGYGAPDTPEGLLPWEWAVEQLEKGLNFWFSTISPGNRPHATPTWAVWYESALYFDGSDQTRRMKNIAANPNVSVHLESGDEVVILEGTAGPVPPPPDPALAKALAAIYTRKYAPHAYAPEPDQWDQGGLYVMRPAKGLGWTLRPGEEFGKSYTRWRWE